MTKTLSFVSIDSLPTIQNMQNALGGLQTDVGGLQTDVGNVQSQLGNMQPNLFPSNCNFAYWSCAKEPKFLPQTFVPSCDGWVIYRYESYSGNLTRVAKTYRVADTNDPRNFYVKIHKINNNRENSQMNFVRPFTAREFSTLKGISQLTLSFDYLCGVDIQEEYPPHIYIFGQTENSEQSLTSYQVEGAGTYDYGVKFPIGHVTILDEALPLVTESSTKVVKTFTLPADVKQLAVCIYFRNTNTYNNVGDNCWVRIGKIRLDKGATAHDFVVGEEGANELKNRERYQRLLFSFRGTIDSTQYAECTRNFFPRYMNAPTCIYVYETVTPSNVVSASESDPSNIKNYDDTYSSSKVSRVGTSSETPADSYYYTTYTFVDKKLW